jgi:hypothetical protein
VDRFVKLSSLLLALLLLAALAGAASASAARADQGPGDDFPIASGSAFEFDESEEEDEAEDGEDEAWDCESADQAAEEACEEALEEREEEEAEAEEAEECRLESAEATVTALPARNQVRLTVRYRAYLPSAVDIDLGLRGGKGGLDLGTETAHFARTGTLHATEDLSDSQMTRALAAREFTVDLQAVNTPRYCGDEFERHLSARKDLGSGAQWSDPSEARRAREARD